MTLHLVDGDGTVRTYKVTVKMEATTGISLGEIIDVLEGAGFDVRSCELERDDDA